VGWVEEGGETNFDEFIEMSTSEEKSGKSKKEHFAACRSRGTGNAKHFYVYLKTGEGVIND
jgi:hypothetical protein